MLYERWRQIAGEHAQEIALREVSRQEQWTFNQLAELSEVDEPSDGALSYPQGLSAAFIFSVLRAWRCNKVVCPLEPGQPRPTPANLPPGIVHLKTTSATTGAPRLIAFTAAQLMADATNIVETMELRPDWPNVDVISLAHSYGFSSLVLPLVLHGIPLILAGSPLPEMVRQATEAVPDVTLPAVPALWRAWHDAGTLPTNIRLAISAGATLPLALEQEVFATAGIKLHTFYGASECGGIAYDTQAVPRENAACAGEAMKNVRLRIVENGCLEVRSGAVGELYWPECDPNLQDGCYRTSDVAELREGKVFLRGRASDQINVAGRKVSPESIERVLLTHPNVADCLVFGVPSADAERSEIIVACVAPSSPVSHEILRQFLLAELPGWQVPRNWWLVNELGTNQRGKISRPEWRNRYLAENHGGNRR